MRGRVWPSDPAVRASAQALEEQLDVATALRGAGEYPDAIALATKNLRRRRSASGSDPLVAEKLARLGPGPEGRRGPGSGAVVPSRQRRGRGVRGGERRAALACGSEVRFRAYVRWRLPPVGRALPSTRERGSELGQRRRRSPVAAAARAGAPPLRHEGKYDDAREQGAPSARPAPSVTQARETPRRRSARWASMRICRGATRRRAAYYNRALRAVSSGSSGPDHPKGSARAEQPQGSWRGTRGSSRRRSPCSPEPSGCGGRCLGDSHPRSRPGLANLALIMRRNVALRGRAPARPASSRVSRGASAPRRPTRPSPSPPYRGPSTGSGDRMRR